MPGTAIDRLILLLLSENDGRALEVLQDTYGHELFKITMNLVEVVADAEDIMQETYITLWEKRHEDISKPD
ncbi:hypothetical protein LVD15_04340 [Fulvivirga maritima]|uniref:RNA polymerase sigma factor n=1 Tax=Fulvivirga maritima TaxID=2904247 RepID=UPI001F1E649D|nr:sigma factor [Fulvivirga maritima]UII27661.1 hypothetical protein LVD15_04340 [Fulvivirga maritima]